MLCIRFIVIWIEFLHLIGDLNATAAAYWRGAKSNGIIWSVKFHFVWMFEWFSTGQSTNRDSFNMKWFPCLFMNENFVVFFIILFSFADFATFLHGIIHGITIIHKSVAQEVDFMVHQINNVNVVLHKICGSRINLDCKSCKREVYSIFEMLIQIRLSSCFQFSNKFAV